MKQLLTLTGAITALISSRAAIAEYGLNMTKGVSTISGDIYSLHMMVFWVCFVIAIIIIGEIFAPIASEEAQRGRSKALDIVIASQSQEGFWIRDGESFINVQKNIDGKIFSGVTVIEVNSSNKISTVVTSEQATFDGKSMDMKNNEIFSIDASKEIDDISLKERNSYNKTVSFDQDLIDSLKKEPDELTTWNIIKQIQFLSENNQIRPFVICKINMLHVSG